MAQYSIQLDEESANPQRSRNRQLIKNPRNQTDSESTLQQLSQ